MKAMTYVAIAPFAYAALAYLVLPALWRRYDRENLVANAFVSRTSEGIAGDPFNVGLVGDLPDILGAMDAAGWHVAAPITFASCIRVVGSVALNRSYRDAPVSSLFYEGRKQDLAFEKEVGTSPVRRHHVRFWKAPGKGVQGHAVWFGAATLDRNIGISRYTGQITHHIEPDVDTERDHLIGDLMSTGRLTGTYTIFGSGPTLNGRNGGGDWYYTDGKMLVAILKSSKPQDKLPLPAYE
jgi:hypothetical protein